MLSVIFIATGYNWEWTRVIIWADLVTLHTSLNDLYLGKMSFFQFWHSLIPFFFEWKWENLDFLKTFMAYTSDKVVKRHNFNDPSTHTHTHIRYPSWRLWLCSSLGVAHQCYHGFMKAVQEGNIQWESRTYPYPGTPITQRFSHSEYPHWESRSHTAHDCVSRLCSRLCFAGVHFGILIKRM